jgi:hypothetical protein
MTISLNSRIRKNRITTGTVKTTRGGAGKTQYNAVVIIFLLRKGTNAYATKESAPGHPRRGCCPGK